MTEAELQFRRKQEGPANARSVLLLDGLLLRRRANAGLLRSGRGETSFKAALKRSASIKLTPSLSRGRERRLTRETKALQRGRREIVPILQSFSADSAIVFGTVLLSFTSFF